MNQKFIVDTMLGKLGRWMSLLGYDVVYFRGHSDEELIQAAGAEQRIIITRDTHLALEGCPKRCFLIKTIHFWEQLKRIVEAFPMDFSKTFLSRCNHCNCIVEEVKKEEILGELPEKVKEWATKFYRCPCCEKLYWNGTHPIHIARLLEENLDLCVKKKF